MSLFLPFFSFGCFLVGLSLPALAWAGDGNGGLPQADLGAATLRMVGALVVVLVVIVGLFYAAKQLRLGRFSANRYPLMRVISTLNLAPKRSLAIVEVCGQWMVLGVGPDSVTLLLKLQEPPVVEPSKTMGSGNISGFQTLLRRKLFHRPPLQNDERRE